MLQRIFTGHTRAEKTLQETQQNLELALQAGNIGLWNWNAETNAVHFSPEWKRQLGYRDDELEDRFEEWEERIHPEDRDSTLTALNSFLEGRRTDYEVEFRLRHKDGSYRWILARALLQVGPDGKPYRMSGCHLDITERKRTEGERAKLLAREHTAFLEAEAARKQLGNMLERVSDAFVALDKEWRYTYLNQQAAKLFGRTPNDLIGKHIWTEFPEGVGQPFHLAYERAMAEQVPLQIENYYEPWNRWFENRIYPSADGLSIFFHEITVRKQAEQAAHESAELLKGQNLVLELIAKGATLQKTLDSLVRAIEARSPGMFGSILLLDVDGVHVRHCAAPSLPESYIRAIDGEPIGPCAGSCGTAAFRREPVIVEDIATDPLWEHYRDFALEHGLRACWSTPIFDEQHRVLGTFAMYFHTAGRPTEQHRKLIEMATHTAAIAIVKHRESEALRSSEEQIRRREVQLVEAQRIAQFGSYEWDPRDNSVHRSEELCRIFGLRPDEFGPTFEGYLERVHPEDRKSTRNTIERSYRDKKPFEFEERIIRPDGAVRLLRSQGKWILDEAGNAVKLVGICQDITERKQAEDQIRRSEERFQMVARATNDAIWDWDLTSDTVWWNQAITTLFKYSAEDVIADSGWMFRLFHPQDREHAATGLRTAMDRGEPFWSGEHRVLRADGSFADIFNRAFILYDDARRPARVIGAMTDISERKRALNILEERVADRTGELQAKNQELQREVGHRRQIEELLRARNEELRAFAYTVSHDLKAPLRGIAGYAQELDRRHRKGLGERAIWCLKQILTATHNLDRLIEDLLHYSRLDAQNPSVAEIDLTHMVDAILKERRPVILEEHAEIAVNLVSSKIYTWERGFRQVLTNLIDNALKYSRGAAPPRIQITSQELPHAFRIMVADNGIGFDMKYRDRIFGLFNRLVRQEEFEGTGAGLAIVKKVVEKLDGKIWAEAQPGFGAKFFVEIPKSHSTVQRVSA